MHFKIVPGSSGFGMNPGAIPNEPGSIFKIQSNFVWHEDVNIYEEEHGTVIKVFDSGAKGPGFNWQ